MSTLPPLSLYIHIPWCVRKCPYCDFNSHAVKGEIPEAAYVAALLRDLQLEQPAAQGREIDTIFIGGGTPSLFTADAIAQILDGANQIIPFSRDIEITMEANPGTFEQERFAGYLNAGVNRLSVGVQSFNPTHLKALGRIHSGDEAKKAIMAAGELGFPHLNIDLMHGLPDQTPEQALHDLETAIALGPDHLSWYQLTIEPNTEFFNKPPIIPQDETLWDIQQAGQSLIATAGFQQYEVSAYAKGSQARARHNLNYWQFGDYIGIGAGAHGKVSFPEQDLILRRWKQRSPKAYLQSINPLGGEQEIAREDRPFEFMMNALRLIEGVDESCFPQRTYMPLSDIADSLSTARTRNLLEASRLQATPQGQLFLNDLLETFISG
ncbi:radical SAM family heme chaperone HemW [Neptunomonas antarctica]|uniref:Heme chaperone HemW n=1 Tax=Neptunomonas antarctica TaxID=619304 RepID=A0A1N7J134_9GAMM|nr:radical SAM family heme chaperone HemW [Neptunomonas antarctica]SIS42994.1 coproporphyrinogen III oxidase, anaerobic [Neptunomonas antarctica]